MLPPEIDFSVYLVTDSTPAVLGAGRNVVDVVAAALRDAPGCVGVVQLREKRADARTLLTTLAALHVHTAAAGVPLLVNDRVDVAVAAMAAGDCEGVHLGQDDLDVATARRLLGAAAVIGVTASTPDEAVAACRAGADYLGLGTVFATATKTDTKHVVGATGIQRMLRAMAGAGFGHVPAVCIGGVHIGNARRVINQSAWMGDTFNRGANADGLVALRGVAVVRAIMGAADPGAAARALAEDVRNAQSDMHADFFAEKLSDPWTRLLNDRVLAGIVGAVRRLTPLLHNMTNLVVQNFAANVALAIGASPIMSTSGAEVADLAKTPYSALVINMGTVSDASLAAYVQAIPAYNAAGRPVIFDPVGAGATDVRRQAVRTIFDAGYISVIKGNAAEIQAVYEILFGVDDDQSKRQRQRGVDGSTSALNDSETRKLVRALARCTRCVVVLTGAVDYVCDSFCCRVVALCCGHPIMAQVTGTGCALGTVLAATTAVVADLNANGPKFDFSIDAFDAAIAGVALYGHAAEKAMKTGRVQGPGTFVPVFLDELARCQQAVADGDVQLLKELELF